MSAVIPIGVIMLFELGIGVCSLFALLLLADWFTKKKTELNGSHVLITGGSSGIGKAVAIQAAQCGANVTLVARNKEKLEEARREVESCSLPSRKILTLSVDLASDASVVETTINKASSIVGPVDVLINCAGYAVCGLFEETKPEDFKNMINTNYIGSVYATQAVIKSMKERRKGHVVLVSSVGGQFGIFGFTAYSPSKFAVRGFAETLLMEVKPYNIGVSVVFPPDTDTPGFENENKNKPEETQLICSSGGLFKSEEVASTIIKGIKSRQFLISCGFDGFVINTLTCGVSPASSWFELFTQVMLMGPFRLVLALYGFSHDKIVLEGMKKRQTAQKSR